MENKTQVIGNEGSIIYYNLNKQFSTVNKVIITKEIILNSFDNEKVKELIAKLQESTHETYNDIYRDNHSIFNNINLNNELYKKIQESLNKISNNYMDVKLKDYNFMNSVSNTKFNVTLRCENFSITNYYIEKGTIISNIKNLIKEYLRFEGNSYRLGRLENFQVEIYQSEEIYKHVFLKKENNSIVLNAFIGFPKNNPIDYGIGGEFYISDGPKFQFFKNKQITAVIREHNKLVEKEIKKQEKVLSNEDLVLINKKTKNIDDALIEGYINAKNQLRILNVSLIENSIGLYSENGFVITKSSNNYDRISILTTRDNFDEETINPKYLLLKNDSDIKEFMTQINMTNKVDGIIFTQNFYNPILEKLGHAKNIDILCLDKNIKKSIDEKINWECLDISNSSECPGNDNPFSGIITDQNKEKDAFLERLKNVDLNTPEQNNNANSNINNNNQTKEIENAVNSIIGSKESSFNKGNNNIQMTTGINSSGKKKSAIGMLAESVLKQGKPVRKEPQQQQQQQQMQYQAQQQQMHQNQNMQTQTQSNNAGYSSQFGGQQPQNTGYNNPNNPNSNFANQNNNNNNNNYNNPNTYGQQAQQTQQNNPNSYSNPNRFGQQQTQQTQQNNPNTYGQQQQTQEPPKPQENTSKNEKYSEILATEIIGTPEFNVDAYFADANTISQIRGGKTYFLTLNKEEMQNPNLKYILPIGLNAPDVKNCALLINNVADFFLINKEQEVDYFVSVHEMNDAIKKSFIDEMLDKVNRISLICLKKDIDLLENSIHKIKSVQIKDANSNEELDEIRRKLLAFEKRYLFGM